MTLLTRIAFRFVFLYFTLFCLSNQIAETLLRIPSLGELWPLRPLVFWTASTLFGAKLPHVYTGSGSGDKTFDWVLCFCLLVIAVLGTAVWSVIDRRREDYAGLYKWFRVFLRFALASQMVSYGMAKVAPLQMPFPNLTRLLEPYRDFSPMGVLWASIGASPSYEMFAGVAELVGGLLLFVPATAMLGALVSLLDMVQVFMLNMTYDVPVKLFSFHLLLMSLVLLAPDLRRLAAFLLTRTEAALFANRRDNVAALVVQIVIGVALVGFQTYGAWTGWDLYGPGAVKSPLYGIWDIEEMKFDGVVRPPLVTDLERWRRAAFETPERMAFQKMDETFTRFQTKTDAGKGTLELIKGGSLQFVRPAEDRLEMKGTVNGRSVEMRMKRMDRSQFLLVSRGFHWVQEYPFNR